MRFGLGVGGIFESFSLVRGGVHQLTVNDVVGDVRGREESAVVVAVTHRDNDNKCAIKTLLTERCNVPVCSQSSLSKLTERRNVCSAVPVFFSRLPTRKFLLTLSVNTSIGRVGGPATRTVAGLVNRRSYVVVKHYKGCVFEGEGSYIDVFARNSGRTHVTCGVGR